MRIKERNTGRGKMTIDVEFRVLKIVDGGKGRNWMSTEEGKRFMITYI